MADHRENALDALALLFQRDRLPPPGFSVPTLTGPDREDARLSAVVHALLAIADAMTDPKIEDIEEV